MPRCINLQDDFHTCSKCERFDGMGCYTRGIDGGYEYKKPDFICTVPNRFKPKDGNKK